MSRESLDGNPVSSVGDFEKILDVPYYSQFTEVENHGIEEHWKRRGCGLLCLKMVMDYWREQVGTPSPPLPELIETALEEQAYDDHPRGVIHDGLIRTAKRYGLIAWRRRWLHTPQELVYFQSQGWTPQAIKAIAGQTAREGIMTLTNAIVADIPVMVSVPKEFNPEVGKQHLVVLTGIKKDALLGVYRGFYVNDPYNPKRGPSRSERKHEYVTQKTFIKNWIRQGIFVIPPSHKFP